MFLPLSSFSFPFPPHGGGPQRELDMFQVHTHFHRSSTCQLVQSGLGRKREEGKRGAERVCDYCRGIPLPPLGPSRSRGAKERRRARLVALKSSLSRPTPFPTPGCFERGREGGAPFHERKTGSFSPPSFIPRNPQSGCCCPAEQRQHANHRHRNKPLNLGAWLRAGGTVEDCSAVLCLVGRILGGTRKGAKGGRSTWPRAR